MTMRLFASAFLYLFLALAVGLSCGGSGSTCDPVAQSGCESGQVCELVEGGEPACFDPLTLRGTVIDLETEQPIAGARVVALDANGSAASSVAITDADGNYEIQVFSTRDADGNPISKITLRADADGYQSYPGGGRNPFVVDLSAATIVNGSFILENDLTDIGLNPLLPGAGTASLEGTAPPPEDRLSVLVVAELTSGAPCPALPNNDCTAIAGEDGTFAIYNLPAGEYAVKAFVQGSTYNSVNVVLGDGATINGISLARSGEATGTLNGKVNIVNPGMGNATTVILVVKSTLVNIESALLPGVPVLIRGATPPGLRVAAVTGDFTMEGVPAGDYVILAAYEDDFLVRDPDVCIAGTQIIEQAFSDGQQVTLSNPFKITGSLDDLSPDGLEVVGPVPTFTWQDDSSEDTYQITVIDSFGNIIWDTTIPGVSGTNPSVDYDFDGTATEALQSGQFYQVHVFSVKDPGGQCVDPHAISSTEDLKGTFQVQ